MGNKVSVVVMASGHSKRFGSNKLWVTVDGVPLIQRAVSLASKGFDDVVVVARDPKILELAALYGATAVKNSDETDDIATTIRLGIENISEDSTGCALMVADQPYLGISSIKKLVETFLKNPNSICRLYCGTVPGNPAIFPSGCFDKLRSLKCNECGRKVIKTFGGSVEKVQVYNVSELMDIDERKDINE